MKIVYTLLSIEQPANERMKQNPSTLIFPAFRNFFYLSVLEWSCQSIGDSDRRGKIRFKFICSHLFDFFWEVLWREMRVFEEGGAGVCVFDGEVVRICIVRECFESLG